MRTSKSRRNARYDMYILLDVVYSPILLVYMIRLINAIMIMIYLHLFQIKSYVKLLIYSSYNFPRLLVAMACHIHGLSS
jgi:hypothetical protein